MSEASAYDLGWECDQDGDAKIRMHLRAMKLRALPELEVEEPMSPEEFQVMAHSLKAVSPGEVRFV